jgi:hypothetical protein
MHFYKDCCGQNIWWWLLAEQDPLVAFPARVLRLLSLARANGRVRREACSCISGKSAAVKLFGAGKWQGRVGREKPVAAFLARVLRLQSLVRA